MSEYSDNLTDADVEAVLRALPDQARNLAAGILVAATDAETDQ